MEQASFLAAIRTGWISEVQRLLAEGKIEVAPAQCEEGAHPLVAAVESAFPEVARLLVAHSTDVDAPVTHGRLKGWTALMSAARAGDVPLVQVLLAAGASPNTQDKDGDSPLHVATSNNHCDAMRMLLSRGADINMKGEHGHTPLHVAAENGHVDAIRVLLDHGADRSLPATDGSTPEAWARQHKRIDAADVLRDYTRIGTPAAPLRSRKTGARAEPKPEPAPVSAAPSPPVATIQPPAFNAAEELLHLAARPQLGVVTASHPPLDSVSRPLPAPPVRREVGTNPPTSAPVSATSSPARHAMSPMPTRAPPVPVGTNSSLRVTGAPAHPKRTKKAPAAIVASVVAHAPTEQTTPSSRGVKRKASGEETDTDTELEINQATQQPRTPTLAATALPASASSSVAPSAKRRKVNAASGGIVIEHKPSPAKPGEEGKSPAYFAKGNYMSKGDYFYGDFRKVWTRKYTPRDKTTAEAGTATSPKAPAVLVPPPKPRKKPATSLAAVRKENRLMMEGTYGPPLIYPPPATAQPHAPPRNIPIYPQTQEPLGSVTFQPKGPAIFQADRILGQRKKGTKVFYLVKWHGFDDSHNTWEPEANVVVEPALLAQWRLYGGGGSGLPPLASGKKRGRPRKHPLPEPKPMPAAAAQMAYADEEEEEPEAEPEEEYDESPLPPMIDIVDRRVDMIPPQPMDPGLVMSAAQALYMQWKANAARGIYTHQ